MCVLRYSILEFRTTFVSNSFSLAHTFKIFDATRQILLSISLVFFFLLHCASRRRRRRRRRSFLSSSSLRCRYGCVSAVCVATKISVNVCAKKLNTRGYCVQKLTINVLFAIYSSRQCAIGLIRFAFKLTYVNYTHFRFVLLAANFSYAKKKFSHRRHTYVRQTHASTIAYQTSRHLELPDQQNAATLRRHCTRCNAASNQVAVHACSAAANSSRQI